MRIDQRTVRTVHDPPSPGSNLRMPLESFDFPLDFRCYLRLRPTIFHQNGSSRAEAVKRISGRAVLEIKPIEKEESAAVVNIKTTTKLEEAVKKAAALGHDTYKGIIFTRYGISARLARTGLAEARQAFDPDNEKFKGCEDVKGEFRSTLQGAPRDRPKLSFSRRWRSKA